MKETINNIDRERAIKASKSMDKIRKSKKFDGGKKGTQIVRLWRDKRKISLLKDN